jgi:hypothetical protein
MLCQIILKTDCGGTAPGGNLAGLGDVRRSSKRAGTGFLKAELGLYAAFAQVAITAPHPEKIERNKEDALEGYQTILHLVDELPPDTKRVADIRKGLADLSSLLTRLQTT